MTDEIFGTVENGSVDKPKEPEGTIDGLKKNALSLLLLILGILVLVVLVVFGAFRDADTQAIMIYVAFGLIIFSVVIAMKDKLMTMFLAMAILAVIYFAEGWILHQMGMLSSDFSWGVVTACFMGIFVYWIGLDNELTPKDITIVIVFMIVAYLVNASGWMSKGNEATWQLITGVKSAATGAIMVAMAFQLRNEQRKIERR